MARKRGRQEIECGGGWGVVKEELVFLFLFYTMGRYWAEMGQRLFTEMDLYKWSSFTLSIEFRRRVFLNVSINVLSAYGNQHTF